ncbi:adenosylmethionine--8-amino-7-oxononanoate transaminase [Pseudodesulfovibrio sp.]|uniref:adenosylmethionine--8-amino-7-oxononanoate transaminase n=1 Tax=unclassified Pseudodesulfovibrio TaxID=2661612 RepID=UPI003AFFE04C
MQGYFITGTDTGVGKTRVTAALLRAFLDLGLPALAVKPVQTGCFERDGRLVAEDVEEYARLAAPHFPAGYPDACCRKYIPACSPHLAARLAGESLDIDALRRDVLAMGKDRSPLLVEGAGGVAVPLSDSVTTLDFMHSLGLPVVIVADNKLGMINHALMTIDAVRNHGLDVAGIVVNNTTPPGEDAQLRAENVRSLALHGNVPILTEIPCLDGGDEIFIERITKAATSLPGTAPQPTLNESIAFDREHLWHPYTSALHPIPALKVASASGTRLTLADGREVVDGMASWWCAIHGYNHPELNRAARAQIGRMSHVMFGGLTHDPAIELGRTLLEMAPDGLEHVFFADSGSVSVEVAIKMALQYMQASGRTTRTRLLTVRGGYHGDTCGAMSVCDPENGMHGLFTGLLPRQFFAPRPRCRFGEDFDPADLSEVRTLLAEHEDEIAAIIVEPVVQGAGGMHFYHPDYLRGLRELADQHGVLLILDEIATGFGRTGKLFACHWADVVPDIMCVGKALTGGTMTLAATLATGDVARTLSSDGGVLMHGPTFMANPLACAVARASLDLLRDTDWQGRVHAVEGWLKEALAPCNALDAVADVRVLGAIGVVEMKQAVNVPRLQEFLVERGVWLRPFSRLVYAMPPYIITQDDVERIGQSVHAAIAANAHA